MEVQVNILFMSQLIGWILGGFLFSCVYEAGWSFMRALTFSHGASKSFRADQAGVVQDIRLHLTVSSMNSDTTLKQVYMILGCRSSMRST